MREEVGRQQTPPYDQLCRAPTGKGLVFMMQECMLGNVMDPQVTVTAARSSQIIKVYKSDCPYSAEILQAPPSGTS